jgi:hypothetical protein
MRAKQSRAKTADRLGSDRHICFSANVVSQSSVTFGGSYVCPAALTRDLFGTPSLRAANVLRT